MAPPESGENDPASILVECIEDPDGGRERLPRIVGMLDSDDRLVRQYGACACCLLAEHLDEEIVEYVVRRLTDRLGDQDVSLEVTTALDYVSNRYSEHVETVLEEIEDEASDRTVPLARVGNFTRGYYYDSEPERSGVGRTEVPGEQGAGDPRRAYADRQREERERVERERERDAAADSEGRGEESPESEGGPGDASSEDGGTVQQRTEVSSIAARSQFDKLHILAARERGRYADAYEALVGRGGEEQAVNLRLLTRPEDSESWPEFEREVGEALFKWDGADDHEHVVTLLDWDVEPRPWLASMFTGNSLADRDPVPVERALADGVTLADAVSHLHNNGVVHGGLDPKNVVYPGEMLDGDGQAPPMLNNVGLLQAYRYYVEPALCLDPRYAAPEYYDDQYGRVDHATDIYHLGGVIYRLLTGQPPHSGTFAAVREGVLRGNPTPPSEVVGDLPAGVDAVISKAMATQKLTRYETVEHLQQELESVREEQHG